MLSSPLISSEILKSTLPPLIDEFLDPKSHIGFNAQVADSIESGRRGSILVPAVNFIIKASIEVCNAPSNRARLSNEVLDRSGQIIDVAADLGELAILDNWFHMYLAQDSRLCAAVDADMSLIAEYFNPRKPRFLKSMVKSPFDDTAYVAGGAKGKLDQEGVRQNHAEIIGRSASLLTFAQIDGHKTRVEAEELLGGPYIAAKFYEVKRSPLGVVDIGFNEDGVTLLRKLMVKGRGCPVAGMYEDETPEQSVLRLGWEKIVRFLITPQARLRLTN